MTNVAIDDAKLDALILFIVNRVENPADLGATKLHKILWFSDLAMFANHGKSIAGETYIKMPQGPWGEHVESSLDRLKASGLLAERREPHYNRMQRRFFPLQKIAERSRFSPEEISVVEFDDFCDLLASYGNVDQRLQPFIYMENNSGQTANSAGYGVRDEHRRA